MKNIDCHKERKKGYASSGNTPSIDEGKETHNLPTISQKRREVCLENPPTREKNQDYHTEDTKNEAIITLKTLEVRFLR
jgi:hypothetical protein